MRKQQNIWHKEHKNQLSLPSMADTKPSSAVIKFVEWMKDNGIAMSGTVIDIGCGKGRNAVFLAKQGLSVSAFDYIESALKTGKKLADSQRVNVDYFCADMDSIWPFEDSSFDFAIDSFASIDIESLLGREKYRNELMRVLKPKGIAMIAVVSADDEWEKELISKSPGNEPNSTIWPQNGKFQKDYTEDELRKFYKDFEIVEFQKLSKPANKLGKDYTATNLWMVIRKNFTN